MKDTNDQKLALTTFIARLPIFDRKKKVYAYELLYRSDQVNRAIVINTALI